MFAIRASLLWLAAIYVMDVRCTANTPDWENWMKTNMEWLGKLRLKQVCLPGANEAGMSVNSGGTPTHKSCNTICQSLNIVKQLKRGIRYLDLRPIKTGSQYKTGHYQDVHEVGWQGGDGLTIDKIVQQINDFTKDHNELIIACFSRSVNTEKGYKPFDQAEWDGLFEIVSKTNNLYEGPEDNLLNVTIGDMTKNGSKPAVLYILNAPNITLGSRSGKGFFDQESIHLYDNVIDTDKINFMFVDQVDKMRRMAPSSFFVFSWIVTQQPRQIAECPRLRSIKSLAKKTNPKMKDILFQVTRDAYPNVLSANFIEISEIAELTMAINTRWLTYTYFTSTKH